jgi:pyruvate dehydrogenase (quinone)
VAEKRRHKNLWGASATIDRDGAFAAQAEVLATDHLTAAAGSCGLGSLHFINGIFEANRNRAPVALIASQIVRDELGFDFIQEVDFKQIY